MTYDEAKSGLMEAMQWDEDRFRQHFTKSMGAASDRDWKQFEEEARATSCKPDSSQSWYYDFSFSIVDDKGRYNPSFSFRMVETEIGQMLAAYEANKKFRESHWWPHSEVTG